MQPDTLELVADRLRLVTLSLERALSEDHWSEATGLFAERGRLLAKFEGHSVSPRAQTTLREVQATEHRLMANLATWLASVGMELHGIEKSKRNVATYRRNS